MNFAHSEVAALDQNTMRTLCEEYVANNYIDPETSERLGVKRGLRNPDGTGVLAGLTNVCDVVGYKKDQEGHVIPTPGKLIYRGVNINEIVDEAYAGDIIGLFDPGIFSIGDTLCTGKKKVQFAGIPTFSPEHFARIEQKDTMKRKQFVKGMEQIAQEGAIQIFREVGGGMEEVVVGVVGVLQLEVLEYRLNTEYNVEIRMQQLPFEQLRWIQNDPDTYVLRDLDLTSDTKAVEDMKGNRLLLFTSDWAIRWAETHNETLKLSEFGNI